MRILSVICVSLFAAATLSACGVNTSGDIDFNADDIGYRRDSRTGLCFAVVASRETGKVSTSGLGLTNVPCSDEVLALIK